MEAARSRIGMRRRFATPLLAAWCCASSVAFSGCKESYRIGDYVLVDWCDGQYPAYIVEKRGRTRFRVHFDGYESRWDTDVRFEDIRRRLQEQPKNMPPLCDKVARALGIKKESDSASAYRQGARVKVTWRDSVYKATITEILAPDKFKVHYDGHESFWDEVITGDRIVGAAR